MNTTERRLKTLENEMMSLRISLEQLVTSPYGPAPKPHKNRAKLLDLFGTWEGDIDPFLQELYSRRERRGRIE
jgi:hypothetical protein